MSIQQEVQQDPNDPNFVAEFDDGNSKPFATGLVPQDGDGSVGGIRLAGVYFSTPKRYVLKKAHLSRSDNRMFDLDTGRLVYVSHHWGKNPLGSLDPLDVANTDGIFNAGVGEWESVCRVSPGQADGPFPTFKIRPKKVSRHGRQYVKLEDGTILMNIGKMNALKAMSLSPQFIVGRGSDSKDIVYKCKTDFVGKTINITNERDELVAQITKTTSAMIKTTIFGSGSESTIDIAPGVDCSTILALVYALRQVGKHCTFTFVWCRL
jgi:hypothetical protein